MGALVFANAGPIERTSIATVIFKIFIKTTIV